MEVGPLQVSDLREAIAGLYRQFPQERTFAEDLALYRANAYVLEGKDYFLMGRAVHTDAPVEKILDPSCCFMRQNAWFIWAFSGNMERVWQVKPYYLEFVGWCRRRREPKWYRARIMAERAKGFATIFTCG